MGAAGRSCNLRRVRARRSAAAAFSSRPDFSRRPARFASARTRLPSASRRIPVSPSACSSSTVSRTKPSRVSSPKARCRTSRRIVDRAWGRQRPSRRFRARRTPTSRRCSRRAFFPVITGFPRTSGSTGGSTSARRTRTSSASISSTDFLAPEARTLFERLPHDTVAVDAPIARGATVHARNRIALVASYARTTGRSWTARRSTTSATRTPAPRRRAACRRSSGCIFVGPDEVAHVERAREPGVPGGRSPRSTAPSDASCAASGSDSSTSGSSSSSSATTGTARTQTFVDANELVNRALLANPTEADCSEGRLRPRPGHAEGEGLRRRATP